MVTRLDRVDARPVEALADEPQPQPATAVRRLSRAELRSWRRLFAEQELAEAASHLRGLTTTRGRPGRAAPPFAPGDSRYASLPERHGRGGPTGRIGPPVSDSVPVAAPLVVQETLIRRLPRIATPRAARQASTYREPDQVDTRLRKRLHLAA